MSRSDPRKPFYDDVLRIAREGRLAALSKLVETFNTDPRLAHAVLSPELRNALLLTIRQACALEIRTEDERQSLTQLRQYITPRVARRQSIERAIFYVVCAKLLAHRFSLQIDDGDGVLRPAILARSLQDLKELSSFAFETDEITLYATWPDDQRSPSSAKTSVIMFVYGNSGYDVVSDYSETLEPAIGDLTTTLYDVFCEFESGSRDLE